MSDGQIAGQISEIRQFLYQQKWKEALDKCQAVLDDPRVDEQAIAEVQELRQSIDIKARAESTIRTTLITVDQALKEPSPNYGELLDHLKDALELGNKHYIQRYHSQLLAKMQEVRSRKDIYVRYELDHNDFREALKNGQHEQALEIAQRLLDDALMHQQPAMAESARKWIEEIGNKVHLEQLANSIQEAVERQDYGWACDLFKRLPITYARYDQLAPLVEEARKDIEGIEQDLEEAKARWADGKPNETAQILGDLQRRYKKSRLWRPLWRQFYNDQAIMSIDKGDEAVIMAEFIKAGQQYHRAEIAFAQLLGVFEDDSTLSQSKERAIACKNVCEILAEATDARERGDLVAARAACAKAIKRMEGGSPHVQEAVSMLNKRAADFGQLLESLEKALDELNAAELAPADSDTWSILQQTDRILALGPDLPGSVRRRAEDLRNRTQARRDKAQAHLQKARECRAADPHQAAEAYGQAWHLEPDPNLQKEIVEFMLSTAAAESEYDKKCHWLDGALLVDPDNERAQRERMLISLQPDFDREHVPISLQLKSLEGQPEPPSLELKMIREELTALAEQFKAADELVAIIRQDLSALERLTKRVKDTQEAINRAYGLKTQGKWEEAIGYLNKAADKIDLESQKRRLRDVAAILQGQWDQGKQLYQAALTSRDAAEKAHQESAETHDYSTTLQLARQSVERLHDAFAKVDSVPPVEWTQVGRELDAFEHRARALQDAWEASLDPSQPLAGLVKDLRLQNFEKQDPVMKKLIEELTQRAVSECVAKADEVAQEDQEELAIDWLQTALDLGGEDPVLRTRLETLGQRRTRRGRMVTLTVDIHNYLNRSGGLRTASRLQQELLELTVKDTGQPAWIEAVQRLVATIPADTEKSLHDIAEKHRDTGSDVSEELSRARDSYSEVLRVADEEMEHLRRLLRDVGSEGTRVLEESQKWLFYKNQLRLYNMGASAAMVGDLVEAAKQYERLKDMVSVDAPEYEVYEQEFNRACDNVVLNVENSARKRLSEAQTAVEAGAYLSAKESLREIIDKFYEPVEKQLPLLRGRLTEGIPLGDIRNETNRRLLDAERLAAIDDKLKEIIRQVQSCLESARRAAAAAEKARDAAYLTGQDRETTEREVNGNLELMNKELDDGLARVDAAELEDPGRVCSQQWQQLDKLADQTRAYRAEQQNAKARRIIRDAEIEMRSIRTEQDYQAIKLRLENVNTDALGPEDKTRHRELLDKLEEQAGLPALLRLADEELTKEHYKQAQAYYEKSLAIRTDLTRDAGFAQKMSSARVGAQHQADIETLVTQAVGREPAEAIRLLEQAYNRAEQLGFQPQMQSIQRGIYRVRTRDALNQAEQAMDNYQDKEAKRKAEMALRYAERCDDEASREEARQILEELEERYEKVGRVVYNASGLLESCQWQAALEQLRSLSAEDPLVAPVLQKAEVGYREAQKIEREIQKLIESGRFDDAFGRLTRASIELAISDQDAERLHHSIQTIQDQMSGWEMQLDALVHRITGAESLRISDVDKAIGEAQGLADDKHVVKGLRDQALQLVRSLGRLKKDLEAINKAVARADQLSPDWPAILAALHDVPEMLTFQLPDQQVQVRHHASDVVGQRRREALGGQLIAWKSQLDSLDSLPTRALRDLLTRCEDSKQYTSKADELKQLEDIHFQVELSLEQRQTDELCAQWQAQLADAKELWVAGDVEHALAMIQAVQNEIQAQKNKSHHTQTWPKMNDVWEDAARLRNEINADYERDLEQVLQRARSAVGESSEVIVKSEQECELMLQDRLLSPANKARVQAMCQELADAKAEVKLAESKLAQARAEIRLRKYSEAAATLALAGQCPRPLRAQWDALSHVVSEMNRAAELLEGESDTVSNAVSLNAQLAAHKDCLQRCLDLDDNWPAALTGELWMHDLHGELRPLSGRVSRALCDTIGRLANLALNDSNPNEAERLVALARNEGWVVEEYQERMEDMDRETAVVRAMSAVESALTTPGGDPDAASQTLAELLNSARIANPQRRERAEGLQRLVNVRKLLEQGQVDLAEQRVNDTRLMDLHRNVFTIISKEVNAAAKDRAIVKGLIAQADKLIYASPGTDFGDVSNWLPELKRRSDEEHVQLKGKLQAIQERVRQEVEGSRQRGDYARLRALNALAQTLNLGEPDIAGLESERKQRFQEELDKARQALNGYAPEDAEPHIEMAKRLSDQDREEVQELRRRLQEVRRTCGEVDRLLSEAEVFIRRYDYPAAASNYQQASRLAPRREAVRSFERIQHEALWQAFEAAVSRDEFVQALETAESALRFGFRTGEWLDAKRDTEQRRDRQVTDLATRAAGPGFTAGKPASEWQGVLRDMDADLDSLQVELERALAWKPESVELNQLLSEVKKRLKNIGAVRLDVRNGWLDLEQGDYVSASKHFRLAENRLEGKHFEITNWQRYATLLQEAVPLLAAAEIGVDNLPGGGFRATCPGWQESTDLLTRATTIFAEPKRSNLLGSDGLSAQKRQHERAMAHYMLSLDISQQLLCVQQCWDEDKWGEAAQYVEGANRNLKKLRDQLMMGTTPPPGAAEPWSRTAPTGEATEMPIGEAEATEGYGTGTYGAADQEDETRAGARRDETEAEGVEPELEAQRSSAQEPAPGAQWGQMFGGEGDEAREPDKASREKAQADEDMKQAGQTAEPDRTSPPIDEAQPEESTGEAEQAYQDGPASPAVGEAESDGKKEEAEQPSWREPAGASEAGAQQTPEPAEPPKPITFVPPTDTQQEDFI